MPSTLKQAIESLKPLKLNNQRGSIARTLLGKFKGVIPPGKTSTQFIKESRQNLYGKIDK